MFGRPSTGRQRGSARETRVCDVGESGGDGLDEIEGKGDSEQRVVSGSGRGGVAAVRSSSARYLTLLPY